MSLQTGARFTLDLSPNPGDVLRVQLPHPEIIAAASPGTSLLLDDGKLRLRVLHVRGDALGNGGRRRWAAERPARASMCPTWCCPSQR